MASFIFALFSTRRVEYLELVLHSDGQAIVVWILDVLKHDRLVGKRHASVALFTRRERGEGVIGANDPKIAR